MTCGCVSMELESVIANAELMMNITLLRLRFWSVLTYLGFAVDLSHGGLIRMRPCAVTTSVGRRWLNCKLV